jgi:hypothetical protein
MSDDIYSVMTTFSDVASLAQGYLNRADGERLLLPLPEACQEGTGVRFVVYLADGTPAFAGAGLCAQTSDQGATVPAAQRFETLLDSLQFDERSRPVYDYIVAVRNAAYAQQPGGAEEVQAEAAVADVDDSDLQAYADAEADVAADADGASEDEPTQYMGAPARAPSAPAESYEIDAAEDVSPVESVAPADALAMPESLQPAANDAAAYPSVHPTDAATRMASFIPPPIPTGLLTRPARATHWQPLPPRRPTPRPSTGLFRYPGGSLPRPARPPRPDIDPAQRVSPAPRA